VPPSADSRSPGRLWQPRLQMYVCMYVSAGTGQQQRSVRKAATHGIHRSPAIPFRGTAAARFPRASDNVESPAERRWPNGEPDGGRSPPSCLRLPAITKCWQGALRQSFVWRIRDGLYSVASPGPEHRGDACSSGVVLTSCLARRMSRVSVSGSSWNVWLYPA